MKRLVVLVASLIVSALWLGACGDRASREQFHKDLETRLEQIDAKIGQLEVKAQEAKEDVRPRLNALVQELKEKRQRAADKLREVGNATDDSWERFKTDAKSAVDDLGETVDRGWKEIVK